MHRLRVDPYLLSYSHKYDQFFGGAFLFFRTPGGGVLGKILSVILPDMYSVYLDDISLLVSVNCRLNWEENLALQEIHLRVVL